MGKRRRFTVNLSESESLSDSKNDALCASFGLGEEETESEEVSVPEDGGSSSEDNLSIRKMVSKGKKKEVVSGLNQEGEEISVSFKQGKGKNVRAIKKQKQVEEEKARIAVGSLVGDAKGWVNCIQKFVKTSTGVRREDYFRTFGEACFFRPRYEIILDSFSEREFKFLEYINKPSNFDESYSKEVRYAFQIPLEYEIMAAKEGEKIWHRGGEGWIGIPLDHFRAGL